MTERQTEGLSVRSYLRVLARWKWLILVVTLVVTAAGAAYTWTRTPMYTASAQLLYVRQIDISNPLSQTFQDTSAQQAEIEAVPTVIRSAGVREVAEEEMSQASLETGYSVSAVLQAGSNNTFSNVVTVQSFSSDPEVAADAANSYAQAFIVWGRNSARQKVSDAIDVVKARMETFDSAGRQSNEYASLEQSLQQLELLEASARGNFDVITQATPPGAPYAPDKMRGIILALAGGLVLSGIIAFVGEQLDTRLQGDDQISELMGLPIIGHVPPLAAKGREGVLPTLTDPSGRAAEAYRLLRSNLEFVGFDGDMRAVVVSSSVQGEGKSVASCNLAVALALAGKKVILIDADLRSPRVHAYLGVPNAVGVSSVLARRVRIDDALTNIILEARPRQAGSLVMTAKVAASARTDVPPSLEAGQQSDAGSVWPDGEDEVPVLRVLTSGPVPPNPGEMVASQRFGEILEHLRKEADVILVDAPAMLPVGDTAAVAKSVDGLVYVVNPALARRPMLQHARSQLNHLPCALLGIIEIAEKRGQGQYTGYYSHADERSGVRRAR